MKIFYALLMVLFFPFMAQAASNASDLTTQCSHSGKNTTIISDATIDRYVTSVIFAGGVKNENVNMRINDTYYIAVIHEHSDWDGYPGDGTDIAKLGFTAYTLGKKVNACVDNNSGFLYGLSF